ncbi:hypothetical protein PGTUg99_027866 [Puccinia graminis f. sp. tritici]|uniref:Uncharacterized protein n=1 Tax=Puccinia graminis f. sp. tritici TaxID=56615 RepID=A0A5B0NFZ1_PUCGR|nr:hypothetical protein PGTUg99_027866 [Puccinia graminis f. sp. tritici]
MAQPKLPAEGISEVSPPVSHSPQTTSTCRSNRAAYRPVFHRRISVITLRIQLGSRLTGAGRPPSKFLDQQCIAEFVLGQSMPAAVETVSRSLRFQQ